MGDDEAVGLGVQGWLGGLVDQEGEDLDRGFGDEKDNNTMPRDFRSGLHFELIHPGFHVPFMSLTVLSCNTSMYTAD